jgi:hypothetical protein
MLNNKSDHVRMALRLMNGEQRNMLRGRSLRDENLHKVNLVQKVLAMDISQPTAGKKNLDETA